MWVGPVRWLCGGEGVWVFSVKQQSVGKTTTKGTKVVHCEWHKVDAVVEKMGGSVTVPAVLGASGIIVCPGGRSCEGIIPIMLAGKARWFNVDVVDRVDHPCGGSGTAEKVIQRVTDRVGEGYLGPLGAVEEVVSFHVHWFCASAGLGVGSEQGKVEFPS